MQTPSIGRIVHYVLPADSHHAGEARPAIIVRVWDDNMVNLQVFLDGENDFDKPQDYEWQTSVVMGKPGELATWFWPPFVSPKPE